MAEIGFLILCCYCYISVRYCRIRIYSLDAIQVVHHQRNDILSNMGIMTLFQHETHPDLQSSFMKRVAAVSGFDIQSCLGQAACGRGSVLACNSLLYMDIHVGA